MNVQEILAENKRRMEAEKADSSFDPCTGIGCSGRRRKVPTPVAGLPEALIPEEMLDDPDYEAAQTDATAWQRLRCRHDFEYWCAVCATVKHKLEGRDVPFMLNRPQRRVAAIMEGDRR
ncbi:MAG: hypothetical protein K2I56_04175, partial [Muribaculaceae bacterium]|nr:hypothetical protein [Muribaculaceae bacterium]